MRTKLRDNFSWQDLLARIEPRMIAITGKVNPDKVKIDEIQKKLKYATIKPNMVTYWGKISFTFSDFFPRDKMETYQNVVFNPTPIIEGEWFFQNIVSEIPPTVDSTEGGLSFAFTQSSKSGKTFEILRHGRNRWLLYLHFGQCFGRCRHPLADKAMNIWSQYSEEHEDKIDALKKEEEEHLKQSSSEETKKQVIKSFQEKALQCHKNHFKKCKQVFSIIYYSLLIHLLVFRHCNDKNKWGYKHTEYLKLLLKGSHEYLVGRIFELLIDSKCTIDSIRTAVVPTFSQVFKGEARPIFVIDDIHILMREGQFLSVDRTKEALRLLSSSNNNDKHETYLRDNGFITHRVSQSLFYPCCTATVHVAEMGVPTIISGTPILAANLVTPPDCGYRPGQVEAVLSMGILTKKNVKQVFKDFIGIDVDKCSDDHRDDLEYISDLWVGRGGILVKAYLEPFLNEMRSRNVKVESPHQWVQEFINFNKKTATFNGIRLIDRLFPQNDKGKENILCRVYRKNIYVGFDDQVTFGKGDLVSMIRCGLYSITGVSENTMKGQIVEKFGIMALDKRYRDKSFGDDKFLDYLIDGLEYGADIDMGKLVAYLVVKNHDKKLKNIRLFQDLVNERQEYGEYQVHAKRVIFTSEAKEEIKIFEQKEGDVEIEVVGDCFKLEDLCIVTTKDVFVFAKNDGQIIPIVIQVKWIDNNENSCECSIQTLQSTYPFVKQLFENQHLACDKKDDDNNTGDDTHDDTQEPPKKRRKLNCNNRNKEKSSKDTNVTKNQINGMLRALIVIRSKFSQEEFGLDDECNEFMQKFKLLCVINVDSYFDKIKEMSKFRDTEQSRSVECSGPCSGS